MTKEKLLNILLVISSLFGYLEWSGDSSSFLFQAECEVLATLFSDPQSAVHPFTLIPLAGQIVLIVTLFQKKPSKILTILGIGCLAFLLGFIFVVGILGANFRIVFSTVPFLVLVAIAIYRMKKRS
ncbi:MAG TPA: hypothetical protein DEP18_08110 [Flavobacteriales bacterium]|nr:hypothetical protein [Flavobacteriales bacterium]HRE73610.1 hypothetical protein [Flavobacteriales bacterium]HRE95335.1 hypothetical protein [Flavobacteriales bacterium]HRJ37257.1 hypothetical protein [Flavobacteriales bacterium]